MRNAALEAYFAEYSVGAGLELPLSVVSVLVGDDDDDDASPVCPDDSDVSSVDEPLKAKPTAKAVMKLAVAKTAREDSVSSVDVPKAATAAAVKASPKLAPATKVAAPESSDSEDEAPKKPAANAATAAPKVAAKKPAPKSSDESEGPPAPTRKPAAKTAREDSVSSVDEQDGFRRATSWKAKPAAKASPKVTPACPPKRPREDEVLADDSDDSFVILKPKCTKKVVAAHQRSAPVVAPALKALERLGLVNVHRVEEDKVADDDTFDVVASRPSTNSVGGGNHGWSNTWMPTQSRAAPESTPRGTPRAAARGVSSRDRRSEKRKGERLAKARST